MDDKHPLSKYSIHFINDLAPTGTAEIITYLKTTYGKTLQSNSFACIKCLGIWTKNTDDKIIIGMPLYPKHIKRLEHGNIEILGKRIDIDTSFKGKDNIQNITPRKTIIATVGIIEESF